MIVRQHPSPNFNDRQGVAVDMLVLHYTGMPTADEALQRMCDPKAEVSAHYMIDEDGSVLQLVDETKRAWHAGVASWRGQTDINSRSIGVEIVNPGHEWGYRDFTEAQYTSVIRLCQDILSRNPMSPAGVVGHSDVAPRRKQDPGERFDWPRLAKEGIGWWPERTDGVAPVSEADVLIALSEIGYDVTDLAAAIVAFQRRFRPACPDGAADEETRRLLAACRTFI